MPLCSMLTSAAVQHFSEPIRRPIMWLSGVTPIHIRVSPLCAVCGTPTLFTQHLGVFVEEKGWRLGWKVVTLCHSHWGAARDSATTSFPLSVAATKTAPKVSQRRIDASPAATAAAADPVRCLDVRATAGSGGPHGAPSCSAAQQQSGWRQDNRRRGTQPCAALLHRLALVALLQQASWAALLRRHSSSRHCSSVCLDPAQRVPQQAVSYMTPAVPNRHRMTGSTPCWRLQRTAQRGISWWRQEPPARLSQRSGRRGRPPRPCSSAAALQQCCNSTCAVSRPAF